MSVKMEAVAKFRNCPVAPRKMRLVADTIRGKHVGEALNILKFTRKEGAYWIDKTLTSAIANWVQLHEGDPDNSDLRISEIRIDPGPMLKRIQPAPQGRAHRVRKRMNHITIKVVSTATAEVTNSNEE